MPLGRAGAAALAALSLAACSGTTDRAIAPTAPAPVSGSTAVFSHAAAAYITQAERLADEHSGTSNAAAEIAYSGFTTKGRFEASSVANADFGRVETKVRAAATDATFPINTALAEASFTDTLQADDPRAAFVALLVDARIDATGLQPGGLHSHGVPDVSSHMFFRHEGGNDAELGGDPMKAGQIAVPRVPVVPGRPLTFSVVLSTIASIPLNYSATVSATTTLTLQSVTVMDADGRAIAGAMVRLASGRGVPAAPSIP